MKLKGKGAVLVNEKEQDELCPETIHLVAAEQLRFKTFLLFRVFNIHH